MKIVWSETGRPSVNFSTRLSALPAGDASAIELDSPRLGHEAHVGSATESRSRLHANASRSHARAGHPNGPNPQLSQEPIAAARRDRRGGGRLLARQCGDLAQKGLPARVGQGHAGREDERHLHAKARLSRCRHTTR